MMNKRIPVILFLLGLSTSLNAQFNWGFEIGYVNNRLKTNIDNQAFTKIQNGSSIGFGIIGRYEFKKINFEIDVQYLQKNYSYVRTGDYTGLYNTFSNSYLQVPALISFQVYKKAKFSVDMKAGGYGSYWVSSITEGNIPNIFNNINRIGNGELLQYLGTETYIEKAPFNSLKDNRIEIGWVGGLSAYYEVSDQYKLSLNCKYYQSLTDQQKKYMVRQIARYNQTLFISLGYSMKF